eukprot:gene4742-3425_t
MKKRIRVTGGDRDGSNTAEEEEDDDSEEDEETIELEVDAREDDAGEEEEEAAAARAFTTRSELEELVRRYDFDHQYPYRETSLAVGIAEKRVHDLLRWRSVVPPRSGKGSSAPPTGAADGGCWPSRSTSTIAPMMSGGGATRREAALIHEAYQVAIVPFNTKREELRSLYDILVERLRHLERRGERLRLVRQALPIVQQRYVAGLYATIPDVALQTKMHMLYWRCSKYGMDALLEAHLQAHSSDAPDIAASRVAHLLSFHCLQTVEKHWRGSPSSRTTTAAARGEMEDHPSYRCPQCAGFQTSADPKGRDVLHTYPFADGVLLQGMQTHGLGVDFMYIRRPALRSLLSSSPLSSTCTDAPPGSRRGTEKGAAAEHPWIGDVGKPNAVGGAAGSHRRRRHGTRWDDDPPPCVDDGEFAEIFFRLIVKRQSENENEEEEEAATGPSVPDFHGSSSHQRSVKHADPAAPHRGVSFHTMGDGDWKANATGSSITRCSSTGEEGKGLRRKGLETTNPASARHTSAPRGIFTSCSSKQTSGRSAKDWRLVLVDGDRRDLLRREDAPRLKNLLEDGDVLLFCSVCTTIRDGAPSTGAARLSRTRPPGGIRSATPSPVGGAPSSDACLVSGVTIYRLRNFIPSVMRNPSEGCGWQLERQRHHDAYISLLTQSEGRRDRLHNGKEEDNGRESSVTWRTTSFAAVAGFFDITAAATDFYVLSVHVSYWRSFYMMMITFIFIIIISSPQGCSTIIKGVELLLRSGFPPPPSSSFLGEGILLERPREARLKLPKDTARFIHRTLVAHHVWRSPHNQFSIPPILIISTETLPRTILQGGPGYRLGMLLWMILSTHVREDVIDLGGRLPFGARCCSRGAMLSPRLALLVSCWNYSTGEGRFWPGCRIAVVTDHAPIVRAQRLATGFRGIGRGEQRNRFFRLTTDLFHAHSITTIFFYLRGDANPSDVLSRNSGATTGDGEIARTPADDILLFHNNVPLLDAGL